MNTGFSQQEVLNWINQFITAEKLNNALLPMLAYGDTKKTAIPHLHLHSRPYLLPKRHVLPGSKKPSLTPVNASFPQSKNFNLLLNFLAYQKAREQNAIETLLINKEDSITEGTRSNVFIIKKNQCLTPPEKDILNGVTRDLLLQWNTETTIQISEKQITKKSLYEVDEVFITSTSMNIMPIVEIDGHKISNGQVGPKTREVHLLFRKKQQEYYQTI
jgi:D-alanine transaminase